MKRIFHNTLGTVAGIAWGCVVGAALMVLGVIILPIWFCAQISLLIHSVCVTVFDSAQTAKTSGKEPPDPEQP
jgi:hypothetical protein